MSENDDLPRISRSELKENIDRNDDFELIEVLPSEDLEEYHIPGAINIPGNELRDAVPDRISQKEREIVVYCADSSCEASPRAARLLLDMGYTNVRDYEGGKEDWRDGGLPVESGPVQHA